MRHAPSQAGPLSAENSADQSARSTDQSAHLGTQIAFPDLCHLRAALAHPLELLRQAAWQEFDGNTPTLPAPALISCAQEVFAHVHAILSLYEETKLTRPLRRQCWDAQGLILLALPGRLRELKQLQIDASAGRPLTICFGHRARHLPLPAPFNYVAYPEGDGCGLVYPDSTTLRRPSFRLYCPTCSKQTTLLAKKALANAQALSQGRHRVVLINEHGQPIPGWAGPCSSCGREFVDTEAQARRCARCQRGHRAAKIRVG
jgi:hypothetical protein